MGHLSNLIKLFQASAPCQSKVLCFREEFTCENLYLFKFRTSILHHTHIKGHFLHLTIMGHVRISDCMSKKKIKLLLVYLVLNKNLDPTFCAGIIQMNDRAIRGSLNAPGWEAILLACEHPAIHIFSSGMGFMQWMNLSVRVVNFGNHSPGGIKKTTTPLPNNKVQSYHHFCKEDPTTTFGVINTNYIPKSTHRNL